MPHFQTVKPSINQRFDVRVRQQPAIAARITGMGDNAHSPGLTNRTHHINGIRRRGRNVIRATRADCPGKRGGTIRVGAGGDQRISDMRTTDRRLIAFANLREHIIPRNRIILRNQFDHAFGACETGSTQRSEQVDDTRIARIILVGKHVHGYAGSVRGHFSAANQRQPISFGRLHGIGPSCGRVMVSDGHSVQAALVGFTNHIIRRLSAIGEHRVAVQIPSGGRRSIGNTRKSHTTIVS